MGLQADCETSRHASENVRLSKVIDCPPSSENDVLVMSYALKGQHILAQGKPTRVSRVLVPPWVFGVSPASHPRPVSSPFAEVGAKTGS